MNNPNLSEPQIYRVQQGRLLVTDQTRQWSHERFQEYDYEESLRMFRDFTGEDNGRSRTILSYIQLARGMFQLCSYAQ